MAWRQRTGSTVCPGCGTLVGVNDESCYTCGRRNPALWGFSPILRRLGQDLGFTNVATFICVGLYVATVLFSMGLHIPGSVPVLSLDGGTLFIFGAAGSEPVFSEGRWWTVLSAGWLHGGLLHIAFNMYSLRQLMPPTAELYGPARTVIIYVVAGAAGFVLSSVAGRYLGWMPIRFLQGSSLTIGASAAIFGLIGALYHYGERSGSSHIKRFMAQNAVIWVLWGIFMPGIDNYAHAGGFLGGWLTSRWLDPLTRERGDHFIAAFVCLAASALAIIASILTGLRYLRY